MGLENNDRDLVVTQLGFGGFDANITAKELADFLEEKVGVLVWRCRLKKSWTPPESHPNFQIQGTKEFENTDDYDKVVPHAFVHFASPESVQSVLDADGCGHLILFGKPLKVSLGPRNPLRLNKRRTQIIPFKLTNVCVDVGIMVSRDKVLVSWSGPTRGVTFEVDPFDGRCKFYFKRKTAFDFKGESKKALIECDFKVEFSVRDIDEVKRYTDRTALIVLLHLSSSPLVYYRTADDDIYDSVPFDLLDDDDPWIRTTDFTGSGTIGRCTSYRIVIPPRNGPKLEKAIKYLKESRVPIESPLHQLRGMNEPNFGIQMTDPFFCVHYARGVSFDVIYMLNVVIHKGVFNQHQLSESFFDVVRTRSEEINVAALRHISAYKRPVFDACKKLEFVQDWVLKNPRLLRDQTKLSDIVEVRRLIITPTRAYCRPPEVELSNRVLRHYSHVSDRFLRVTFMDEGLQKLNSNVLSYYGAPILKMITSNSFRQRTSIFERVKYSILEKGFYCCGRMYTFLAFSSNQLRDRSAWFFAEDKNDKGLTVSNILSWMGKFTNKNVAKCAARMGQCFSSTYATVEVSRNEVDFNFPDVKRNNYIFSDGIGIISEDLAMKVAERLQLKDNPPCAYQIRFAGCKGVVACWPRKDKKIKLHLRQSMNKFQSDHSVVEVCSWTRFQPGFLNRQIITLLSTLEVPDEVFSKMQETMLSKLDQMVENADVAFDILTASCADEGTTAAIMLSAGFRPQNEPHLRSMLSCIRAAQLADLREKSRIFVPSGRWLMGCLDEMGVLEQGQCFVQVSHPCLEDCFSKHGSQFSKTKNLEVVKGLVIVGKNPCLHPGDIRVLEAVDSPDLHHLYDCVVFPQKGDRPHTDEASGSDLDGDLYFVAWDYMLIPPSKQSWQPMEYTPATVKEQDRPVILKHIKDFFARNMLTENLGAICNAHVVHADLTPDGALNENCLRLAELAALAVDFPKTGIQVSMPNDLKPKMYPDFMGKSENQSYKSDKILGRLYRQIMDVYDEPAYTSSSDINFGPGDIYYDTGLEVPGSDGFIDEAWALKCSYVGQVCSLLSQYKVSKEAEIVTGHIWSIPKYSSRRTGDLKEKLRHAYNCLKREFRQHFDEVGPEVEQQGDDEKNAVYEKKASAWYQVTYHPEWVKRSMNLQGPDGERQADPILSFAWVPSDYLARIKVRLGGRRNSEDLNKPIYSLAKYLAERLQM